MASRETGRKFAIRPLTIVIIAVVVLAAVVAISAWRGSESQFGKVPEIRFSTSSWQAKVEPYAYTGLDAEGGTDTALEREISPRQTLTMILPPNLIRSTYDLAVFREGPDGEVSTEVEAVPAGGSQTLTIRATADTGDLRGVVLKTSLPMSVYTEHGEESIMWAEWSIKLRPAP